MFYGWKVVGVLFVMLMFSSGLGFYNHSVIIQVLQDDANFPVETASLAVTLFFVASGASGLIIAPLIEKFDVRYVVGTGVLISSLSLVALGHVSTIPQLFVVYGFFGVGFAGAGLLPTTTLLSGTRYPPIKKYGFSTVYLFSSKYARCIHIPLINLIPK